MYICVFLLLYGHIYSYYKAPIQHSAVVSTKKASKGLRTFLSDWKANYGSWVQSVCTSCAIVSAMHCMCNCEYLQNRALHILTIRVEFLHST